METGIEEANEERLEISENFFIGKAHSPQNDINYKCILEFWSIINITSEAVLKFSTNRYEKMIPIKFHRDQDRITVTLIWGICPNYYSNYWEKHPGWSIKAISSYFSASLLIFRKIIKWS